MKTPQPTCVPLLALSLLCGCPANVEEVGQLPSSTESSGGVGDTDDPSLFGEDEGSGAPADTEVSSGTGGSPQDCSEGGYGCCNDPDADGVPTDVDLDPSVPNPQQLDTDSDGIPDNVDLCPFVVDESGNNTADSDRDGIGNACDLCAGPLSEYQVDGALLPDYMQVRLFPLAGDIDGDGVGDACDNCPSVANCFDFGAGETFTGAVPIIDGVDCQADSDADGIGDACDPDLGGDASSGFGDQDDFDGDGLPNALDACPRAPLDEAFRTTCEGPEDCPEDRECSPSGQCNHRDADKDGVGDVCDSCIASPNPAQALAGGAVDDDPDSDGVGQLCELGAGMGCGDISNAARVAYHPVSVGGSCCTVELLVGDDGQLLRAEGCQTSDLGSCVGLEAPHPEQPGVFIPVRASDACTQAQRNAFECVVLPAGFEVVPGLLNPPPGCDGALDDAGLSLEQNLEQGAVEGENPWLRACRRPQLDGDFDSIGDACDACPSGWDPGGAPYVDSDGMQWPDAGAVCNGDYGECI